MGLAERAAFALILVLVGCLPSHAEKRVALVIGNDHYAALTPLRNAASDARLVAATLKNDLQFQVFSGENLDYRSTNRLFQVFEAAIAPGDTAFVFYAGHGIAFGDENYLLPVDTEKFRPGEENLVRSEANAVDDLIRRLVARGAAASFVVIDACRENPFAAVGVRGIGNQRGLGRTEAPSGVFVLYSAGRGQTALDRLDAGDGSSNSVFTRIFVPLLRQPGLTHIALAKRVQSEVRALAARVHHQQQPAFYDQIDGEIVLKQGPAAASSSSPAAAPEPAKPGPAPTLAAPAQTATLAPPSVAPPTPPSQGTAVAAVTPPVRPAAPSADPCGSPVVLASLSQRRAEPLSAAEECGLKPKDVFKECDKCPEMVVIPAGEFMMGSPEGEVGRDKREGPQHRVAIPKPFAVGKVHVTVDQFAAFVATTGYDAGSMCWTWNTADKKWEEQKARFWHSPGFAQERSHPAVCLSWDDAKAYVAWLSKMTGETYRFLTEAEWEYAARGGTQTQFFFGDSEKDLCRYGNGADQTTKSKVPGAESWTAGPWQPCSDGYGYTAPAGSFAPNGFGLYDMHGNAWQWLEDCGNANYAGAPSDGSAWTSGDCRRRALRGGAWNNQPQNLRAANRIGGTTGVRYSNLGFRVARTLVTP